MATYSIACGICHKPFGTLLIDQSQAIQDMSNKFAVHISTDHRREFKELQKDMQILTILATWYMLMQQATFVQNKPELDKLYEANGNKILELLGMDEEEIDTIDTVDPGPDPSPAPGPVPGPILVEPEKATLP